MALRLAIFGVGDGAQGRMTEFPETALSSGFQQKKSVT
jgi:hypothetical protein